MRTVVERDELAASLRASFGPIIHEADEWRPLADHILALGRAVRAEALEEAAKVAESHAIRSMDCSPIVLDIAAAIRQLAAGRRNRRE